MLLAREGLPFIKDYIEALNQSMNKIRSGASLSHIQCVWLRFVLMGLIITNSLCWERFERFGLGKYQAPALCWMFRRAKIAWEIMLQASVMYIIESYGIQSGILVIDDTDNERSKNTTEIAKVHKIKDKRNGGFFNGQNIILLLLVSNELTIPVGFKFYEPDPVKRAWHKEDKRLRQKGVEKQYRPAKPKYDPTYPTKKELALELIKEFSDSYKTIKIKAVAADALYGIKEFMKGAAEYTGQSQVISQIAKSQLINVNGKYIAIGKFFENYIGKTEEVELRNDSKRISYCSAKFKVKSHEGKYYIIALKYEGETEYRYLIASDMSWRDVDIIKAYSARWLVEVFIEDWKSYEGWYQLAKQQGIEGSDRGLILSLLCDHMPYFHNGQLTRFKNKEQAVTVGSLREKIIMESLIAFIEQIVKSDNPQELLEKLTEQISNLFKLRSSIKHLRKFDTPHDNQQVTCML
jgi:hypothetical protein